MTEVEVYNNFRDKSVLFDPMITNEVIVPETQTGHLGTSSLFRRFWWFLILIEQEVEINCGSVPTAFVYRSSFNLSSTKLYSQVNHSIGSFRNVR